MASLDFIKRTVSTTLGERMINPCYNIGYILGDNDGFISKSIAEGVLSGLQLLPPGVVVSNELTDASSVVTDPVLPPESFMPEVSSKAYTLYNQMKVGDTTLLTSTVSTSSLLQYTWRMPLQLKLAINLIYLESLAVYLELLKATVQTGMASIAKSDISRIDNNIRWVTSVMENYTTQFYDTIEYLRLLQRALLYVRYQGFLFERTYNIDVIGYSDATGGAS